MHGDELCRVLVTCSHATGLRQHALCQVCLVIQQQPGAWHQVTMYQRLALQMCYMQTGKRRSTPVDQLARPRQGMAATADETPPICQYAIIGLAQTEGFALRSVPASLRDDAPGPAGAPLTCHKLEAAPLGSCKGQPRAICADLTHRQRCIGGRWPLVGGREGHVSDACCVAEADPAQMRGGL